MASVGNGTSTEPNSPGNPSHHSDSSEDFQSSLTLYIGISIGVGVAILICIVVIVLLLLHKHGKLRRLRPRRESLRRLFVRGFSTVSQRGVIDSTAEFEMINTSVSSECSAKSPDSSKGPPKKPERRRTRTSSSNAKYENVTLDPKAGFVVRKSASMASGIPYIDGTLESKPKDDEEVSDDVFE